MKAQELFRRLYRTLTSIVLFLILLNSWSPAFRDVYSRTFYYFNIGVCGVILTLSVAVYCFSIRQLLHFFQKPNGIIRMSYRIKQKQIPVFSNGCL